MFIDINVFFYLYNVIFFVVKIIGDGVFLKSNLFFKMILGFEIVFEIMER